LTNGPGARWLVKHSALNLASVDFLALYLHHAPARLGNSKRPNEPKIGDRALSGSLIAEVGMRLLAAGAFVALILGISAGSALRPTAPARSLPAPRIVVESTTHAEVLSE